MNSAFLDTVIFAVPVEPTVDDVTDFIRSLLEWRDLTRVGWVKTYISSSASDCIARAGGGFPPWRAITNAIQRLDIDLQAQDVYKIVQGMLERLPKIEEELGIQDLLTEGQECLPLFYKDRSPVFQADVERLMALICLHRERRKADETSNHAIFSRFLLDSPTLIEYRAQLIASDPDIPALPRPIRTAAVVFECAEHFIAAIDPADVWGDSETNDDFRDAIEMFTRRATRTAGQSYSERWGLGSKFAISICRLNLKNRQAAQMILRACSETILDQNMADTHMLRESLGANSLPVRRGRDTAWRRDVDAELHLHYWNTTQGPELACIVRHNDFDIPVR